MLEETIDVFGKEPTIIQNVLSPDASTATAYNFETSGNQLTTETRVDIESRVKSLEDRFHAFCEHIGNKLGIRVPE